MHCWVLLRRCTEPLCCLLAFLPGLGQDRSLLGADPVLWYTFGVTHFVRPEDGPVMPCDQVRLLVAWQPAGINCGHGLPDKHCCRRPAVCTSVSVVYAALQCLHPPIPGCVTLYCTCCLALYCAAGWFPAEAVWLL